MHPAPSIILFTTLSGLGYGLAAVLGFGLLDPSAIATKLAHILALALIAGGLMSSTLHLGNPQRAWRAFSQWRSSWLSREGVMAVLTFVPLCINAIASVWSGRYLPLPGLIGAFSCGVTVFCTAMIYASLRSVQAWNTEWTPVSYLLFALAGGLVLASFFSALGGNAPPLLPLLAVITIGAAWLSKVYWWARLGAAAALSTPESATGLGAIGKVRLFEPPHMNGNYLTNEMGFRVARKHAARLRQIAAIGGGVLPALLLAVLALSGGLSGMAAVAMTGVALILLFGGTLVERWLFFAEARHAVMNYYGS
ncbi:MAG: DmsC/YnfH family molybdoenzyme membrane anchor subunit [Pseudomonadota bacterium]